MSQRGPEYARDWQWEPVRARVGVTESHREPERDRERSSKSQREQKRGKRHIFSIPKHCFVAKQLNITLVCCDTSKYCIFCRKLVKYALRAKKNGCKCTQSWLHTFAHSGLTICWLVLTLSGWKQVEMCGVPQLASHWDLCRIWLELTDRHPKR